MAINLQSEYTWSFPFLHCKIFHSLPAFESLPSSSDDDWLLCYSKLCISSLFVLIWLVFVYIHSFPRGSTKIHFAVPINRSTSCDLMEAPVLCYLRLTECMPLWLSQHRSELGSFCIEFLGNLFPLWCLGFVTGSHFLGILVESDHSFLYLFIFFCASILFYVSKSVVCDQNENR